MSSSNSDLVKITKEFDIVDHFGLYGKLNCKMIKSAVKKLNVSKADKKKLYTHYMLTLCDFLMDQCLDYDEDTAPVFAALCSVEGRIYDDPDLSLDNTVDESSKTEDFVVNQK